MTIPEDDKDLITRERMVELFVRQYLVYWYNNNVINSFSNIIFYPLDSYLIQGFTPDRQEIRKCLLFYFYMNDIDIVERNEIYELFNSLGIEDDPIIDKVNQIIKENI